MADATKSLRELADELGRTHSYIQSKYYVIHEQWMRRGAEIKSQEERIELLELENALARKCFEVAVERATGLEELVRDIWDAYRCEEAAPNVVEHWRKRMRELGVFE